VNKRGSVVEHGSALALHSCPDCLDGFAPANPLCPTCENTALRAEVVHLRGERAAIAAWLRSEPETIRECNGHRHKDGKKCLVISPMTLEELAAAIECGDYPKPREE
jgi:hypothetical protein